MNMASDILQIEVSRVAYLSDIKADMTNFKRLLLIISISTCQMRYYVSPNWCIIIFVGLLFRLFPVFQVREWSFTWLFLRHRTCNSWYRHFIPLLRSDCRCRRLVVRLFCLTLWWATIDEVAKWMKHWMDVPHPRYDPTWAPHRFATII